MAALMSRGYGVGLPPKNKAVISTTANILINGIQVGFVTNITPTHNRRMEYLRHLNADDAGRAVEQAPSPEDLAVNVQGFALYNKSSSIRKTLLNRLSAGAESSPGDLNKDGDAPGFFTSLNQQHIPFDMVREWAHPHGDAADGQGSVAANGVVFVECYLTSFSSPLNIGTVTVAETAAVQPTVIEEVA